MPIAPLIPTYERILLYGGPGTGKTSAWLDIARTYQLTNTPGVFHVLDTDSTTARMVASSYANLTNLDIREAYDWPEYRQHTANFHAIAKPEDWIIIDQVSSAWQTLQRYFTNEVFHQDMGAYFLSARKAMAGDEKKLKAFQGWTDWTVINAMYLDWIQPLILRPKCHLLATSIADVVSDDLDEKSSKTLFARYGYKPGGQKHLGYQFHSVLLTSYDPIRKWSISTPKDREREILEGRPIKSFTRDYLMGVAGWNVI
jgi:hypothetical protein